jgi:hypothetical protein
MAKKNKKNLNIDINNVDNTVDNTEETSFIENKDLLAEDLGLKEDQSSLIYLDSLLPYRGNLLARENYKFYKYIEKNCINKYGFGEVSYFSSDDVTNSITVKPLPVSTSNDVVFVRSGIVDKNKNQDFSEWIEKFIFSPIPISEPHTDNNQTSYKTNIKRMKIKNPNIDYTNIILFHDLILYPSLLYFVDFEKNTIDYQAFMYHVYKQVLIRTKGHKINDQELLNNFLYNDNDKKDLNKLTENQNVRSGDDLSNPSELLRNGFNATQNIGDILNLFYK